MKRSRSEFVNAAVGAYLRKRQFAETENLKKNELTLQQSAPEMAMRGIVLNESSTPNVVGFSSISGDATAIDQHFTKLKNFVSDAVEPFRTELSYVLFPMFVNLYFELIINGHKTPAQKFHHRHHALFIDIPVYRSVVESLKKVSNSCDIATHTILKSFRENKFIVNFSESTLRYLTRYLKENDHLILLQIFNLHIEVKEPAMSLHLTEEAKSEEAVPSPVEGKSPSKSPAPGMKSLMQAIKKVQEGPPSLPSVCLYTFCNSVHGVSSVALNQDLTLVSAGFENSAIRVWSLTPQEYESSEVNQDHTHIRLACDVNPVHNKKDPSDCKTLRGHGGTVYGIRFVPDSKLLLSCSEDTTVRAWDMKTYQNAVVYRGHHYPIWDLDFSSMGLYFVTASHDRTAKLWSLDRTYPLRTFAGHNQDVDSVKFHPNCNYVATGSSDRTVRLWSVQDGKMVRMFQGHRGSIFALAFSPNGQMLASAGEDRRIKIWDLSTGSVFKELRGHIDTVYSLCFNRDSSVLVSGGLDSHAKVWDIRKGVSYNSSADSHNSPELLGSFATKATNLLEVKYTIQNLMVAVGTQST